MTVSEVCQWLQRLAPLDLSESWDNTGLLLGDPGATVQRLMTCLTLTPQSVAEAIESKADMVVAHHPLPFKAISKLTTETQTGRRLWDLARAGVSVYSPHTAWDSALRGINARLAQLLQLRNCQPIIPQARLAPPGSSHASVSSDVVVKVAVSSQSASSQSADYSELGAGRMGTLAEPLSLRAISDILCELVSDCRPRGVEGGQAIEHVAIACGSGGSLLNAALRTGRCDLFLTGEATFHTCLEVQAAGISLLMIGHFASERFAMVQMASELQQAYRGLHVWASQRERDPVESFA